MARKPRRRSTLGTIWRNATGAYVARYTHYGKRHNAGRTFPSHKLADDWLAEEQTLIARDEWTPPAARRAKTKTSTVTFGAYAERWVAGRKVRGRPLRPRTQQHYRYLLNTWLEPFSGVLVADIDRSMVVAWHTGLDSTKETMASHAYALLRAIMGSAVRDELVPRNPVDVEGASARPTVKDVKLPTPAEIADLADRMPPAHRLMVLLAAWGGFRFGELCGLRRCDVTITDGRAAEIEISRQIVTVDRKRVVGPPKSAAGTRTVIVPPHIVPDLAAHLRTHTQWGSEGLLFPPTSGTGDYLTPGQFYGHKPVIKSGKVVDPGKGWYLARHQIGRDDLPFHRLRHFASTSLMIAGAAQTEVGAILGQSDMSVVRRYQHTVDSRREELAGRLSALADAGRELPG